MKKLMIVTLLACSLALPNTASASNAAAASNGGGALRCFGSAAFTRFTTWPHWWCGPGYYWDNPNN